MKEYGENDGPLGKVPDFSIGVSDSVILAVSFGGFCMLAWSIYSIVLAKLKTAQELDEEEREREISYGERLAQTDVSTLNRAQRRARAKHIMKQQRRLAGQGGLLGPDGENNDQMLLLMEHEDGEHHDQNIPDFRRDNHLAGQHQQLLSRKERQKAAKQVELQERKLLEEDRKSEQKKAQEAAIARRKAKEIQQRQQADKDKKKRLEQKQADELASYRAWKIFLETKNDSHGGNNAITVQEWIGELTRHRIVYLNDLADRFGLEESAVSNRIQELLDASRLSGILEKSRDGDGAGIDRRARFIYISPASMSELAAFVKAQDQFTPLDFAKHITKQLPELSPPSAE